MVKVILICLLLAACTKYEVRYAPMRCQDIQRPELIHAPEESLMCLSDETRFSLEENEEKLKGTIKEYEAQCQVFDRLASQAEEEG